MISEPVAVAPKVAFDASRIGNTKGYELLKSGELESFYIGRSRRVVRESVKRLASAPRTEVESGIGAQAGDCSAYDKDGGQIRAVSVASLH